MAGEKVEWTQIRLVQRLQEDCREKLSKLLVLAHLMAEVAIARILERFWLRLKLFVRGVRRVHTSNAHTAWPQGFWSLDEASEQVMSVDEKAAAVRRGSFSVSRRGTAVVVKAVDPRVSLAGAVAAAAAMAAATATSAISTTTSAPKAAAFQVSQSWESEGSHLCVNVTLCHKSRPVDTKRNLRLEGTSKLKVRVLPGKMAVMKGLHSLYGRIGRLLTSVPDLRKGGCGPLQGDNQEVLTTGDREKVGEKSKGTSRAGVGNSNIYLTCMHTRPVFNSTDGLAHASDCLELFSTAYDEACQIQTLVDNLQEAVQHLWGINPEGLSKRMARSYILMKVGTNQGYIQRAKILSRTLTSALSVITRLFSMLPNI
jgi:hypothetical protein